MLFPKLIHCLALNYKGVGDDPKKDPLYFIKSPNAYCKSGSKIDYPKDADLFWTEVELAMVVKKECKNIDSNNAGEFIEGFLVGADLSCKNIYERDHHLAFSKSRDNFCPVSNQVATVKKDDLLDLKMETYINGRLAQSGNTKDMILNPLESFSYVSKITTLNAGDLILTGTPSGWKKNILRPGDRVKQTIDRVGFLEFSVK